MNLYILHGILPLLCPFDHAYGNSKSLQPETKLPTSFDQTFDFDKTR